VLDRSLNRGAVARLAPVLVLVLDAPPLPPVAVAAHGRATQSGPSAVSSVAADPSAADRPLTSLGQCEVMQKDLQGRATRPVRVPATECVELLMAVDRYPDWYPEAIREVDVLERGENGTPRRARAKLHLAWGPVVKEFDLVLAVDVEPATVKLTRVSDRPSASRFDVTWHVRGDGPTHIDLDLRASLDVPRFLPLGGVGDAVAGGFVDAAARRLS
jgi:hypothetical protein